MKLATRLLTAALLAAFVAVPVLAQDVGDYRTRASGNWSMGQNWQRFNGTTWAPVATPPTGTERITVMPTDSIFVNVPVTVTGRVVNQGRLATADLLTFGDGGVYQHDRDSGTIPMANWGVGSTVHLTGTVATAPADRNQSYHHLVLETPEQQGNLNMNFNGVALGGNLTLKSSGIGRWYLTSAASGETATVTIMGDVIVEGGQLSVHGTGNALTTFVVEHHGNVVVTGGNFSISRGSQANGTTTWRLHQGDFSMQNAMAQNSTLTPQGARFEFVSGEVQQLTLGAGNTLSSLPIEVTNGTWLDMGTSVMGGSGYFRVQPGAGLATALGGGIGAALPATMTGDILLDPGSDYVFNGSVPQSTSSRMPTTVGELVIDNTAGVALTQETTITEVLRLRAGIFDNTVPFTLADGATISYEGGTLLNPVSSDAGAAPLAGFRIVPNYPNPFAGATALGFELPAASAVTVTVYDVLGKEVRVVLDGATLPAGAHTVTADLAGLGAGVYVYTVRSAFGAASGRMLLLP